MAGRLAPLLVGDTASVSASARTFLDELTTGLDPQARRETWVLVADLRDRGVTGLSRSDSEIIVTGNKRMLFSVVSLLAGREIVPSRFQVDQPDLDDAFVALTGRRLVPADDGEVA